MSDPDFLPRKRRKEARPSELIAAALDIFVEKGFAATRLDEVAERAGVVKGTLYRYFANKEELFKAVIREGVIPLIDEAEAMVASHAGSEFALLERVLLGWWQRIGTTRLSGFPKLIVAEARNFPEVAAFYYENVICRGRAMLAGIHERGMASGEFRRCNVEHCIDVVYAPIFLLAVWQHSIFPCGETRVDPEAILRTHLELLAQGLCAA